MSMTNEEINEKLEKVQQHITLTLQAIDLNFAQCNQIVSASMLPTVDKYNEATREIWNNSKLQLLQSQFNTSFGTSELSSLSSKDEKMSD
ncbi:unnamed protein product [Cunninghamella echinulata]